MTGIKNVRRQFSKEFKEDACRLVLEEGRTKADVARSLGISATSLGHWVKQFRSNADSAFPGSGTEILTEDQKKIRQLEKELRRARMERDILKKAITFVADPPE